MFILKLRDIVLGYMDVNNFMWVFFVQNNLLNLKVCTQIEAEEVVASDLLLLTEELRCRFEEELERMVVCLLHLLLFLFRNSLLFRCHGLKC